MAILLVEDDYRVVDRVRDGLPGFTVLSVSTTEEAVQAIDSKNIEAVVMDRMLDRSDVLDTISEWREAGVKTPVVILSSLAGVTDRIAGLRAGADDYLTKPFHVEELEAKLKALLRARDRHAEAEPDILVCGSIRLDRRRHRAERAGRPLLLQPREYRLLDVLAAHCGRVVPRSVLLEKVWNLSFDPRTKIIETHVSRLRDKLDLAAPGEAIETIRGVGYRLRSDA